MAVCVQVPASTANLGPAFDCAAIALNLYLRVSVEPKPTAGFAVRYRGADSSRVSTGDSNLIVQAMQKFAAGETGVIPGARIEIDNDIPIGVGLGSSAAAIVAGLLAGAGLSSVASPDRGKLLRLAVALERHPDNVTAALARGLWSCRRSCERRRAGRNFIPSQRGVGQPQFRCRDARCAAPN